MTAYNATWLDALILKEVAHDWQHKGLLSTEQWQSVQTRYPSPFYSPNVFIRIGLGLFCFILILAAMGLLGLVISPDEQIGFAFFSLFWGVVCIVMLEKWAIEKARHYGSGIDDMLLYVGVTAIIVGLCLCLPGSADSLAYAFVAFPFLLAGAVRYLDRLLTGGAFICALVIVLLVVKDIATVALYLLPAAGLGFGAAAYFFARKGQGRDDWRYWHHQLVLVELLALMTFYAAGNYWIIQQTGADMYQLERPPLPWLFWGLTYAIPLLYIIGGLKQKDRLMLDIGLGCAGAAVFTFRYYFQVMPLAWAAVAAGAVLFLAAYFSINYLQKKAAGTYTYEPDGDTTLLQEIEEQLVEQTVAAQTPPAPAQPGPAFGGGQFGGGGAGSEF